MMLSPKMPKELIACKQHRANNGQHCMSCQFAIDWNVWRRSCQCGKDATGYRTLASSEPVEFFCDEHFQEVPVLVSP